MSPFPVCPIFFSSFDVFPLAGFVTAAEQYHERVSMPSAVDSVPRSHIDTQFKDSFAGVLPISERPLLNLTNSLYDARSRLFIAETFKPFLERPLALVLLVNDQVEHRMSVA